MVHAGVVKLGYIGVFAAAAVMCLLAARVVDDIEDSDTRRGLVWLCLLSGGWAASLAAYLIAPSIIMAEAAYLVGLVFGIATVGPWLYFCSAFTGRQLHRNRTLRITAVGVFLVISVIKVTNPIHGEYFSIVKVGEPFAYFAVNNGLLHWLAMGLAYALAAVGYFMLVELFVSVDYDVRPIAILVVVTSLPVAFDVIALIHEAVLDINYEPLAVAIFAVGVVTVYRDQFESIRLAGARDDPVIVLDASGRIRNVNRAVYDAVPALRGDVIGEDLVDVAPELAAASEEETLYERTTGGRTRYYQVTVTGAVGNTDRLGQIISLNDVTEREHYRQQLEGKNERLEEFASVVSHDLRNPLNVAKGRLELVMERYEDDDDLDSIARSLDRMDALIDDLLTLARSGMSVDDSERLSLATVTRRSWEMVETGGATLDLDTDQELIADPSRLQELLENLFRNAIDHGNAGVTVTVMDTSDGFAVADDGPGIPQSDRDSVFEFGYTTSENGTGFGLAIVREIAEAHGWSVRVEESTSGGARFVFSGVDRANG